jgi:hypothetical protein
VASDVACAAGDENSQGKPRFRNESASLAERAGALGRLSREAELLLHLVGEDAGDGE